MTKRKEDALLQALFSVPIYIRDGDEVHVMQCDPSSNSAETTDHDVEYEIAFAAMGGELSSCMRFYKAVGESGFKGAFLISDIFQNSVRIRILAEWARLVAPLFDKFVKFPEGLVLNDGTPASCRKIIDLSIKYMDMYMDSNFVISNYFFENEEWCEKYDLDNIVQPALNAMMEAIPLSNLKLPMPDQERWRVAYYVQSAVEFLKRTCSGRLAMGSNEEFERSNIIGRDIDAGFRFVNRAMISHLNELSSAHGPNSDQVLAAVFNYDNMAASAASRITKRYVLKGK